MDLDSPSMFLGIIFSKDFFVELTYCFNPLYAKWHKHTSSMPFIIQNKDMVVFDSEALAAMNSLKCCTETSKNKYCVIFLENLDLSISIELNFPAIL